MKKEKNMTQTLQSTAFRFFYYCACAAMLAVSIGSATQSASAQINSGSVYRLRNQCSDKILDVSGASQSNGAAVIQWTDWNGLNQQWKVETTDGGFYKLTAQHSGKAMDAYQAGTSNGTAIVQWDYVGGSNQQWKIVGTGNNYYKLTPRYASGKALDVSGASTADGARVQLWTDNGTCAQRWKFELVSNSTPPPNGAQLFFKSGFEGVSLSAPRDCSGTFQCFQDIIGTDSSSGYSWPPRIWGGTGRFQMIVEKGVTLTPSNVTNYDLNRIDTVTGHNGDTTKALYQELRGSAYNTNIGFGQQQDPYVIEPDGSAQGDLYIRYWMKLQDDLASQLIVGQQPDGGWGNWRNIFGWKTGGQGENWRGDYRIALGILKADNGQLYWSASGDSKANNENIPQVEYWRVNNTSVPVPVGQWFKFEAFWHRSNGSDGRVWMAINGQTIADRSGSNMGVNNNPINRLFIFTNYTGGNYPSYQWVDDVEIWDTFPADASAH